MKRLLFLAIFAIVANAGTATVALAYGAFGLFYCPKYCASYCQACCPHNAFSSPGGGCCWPACGGCGYGGPPAKAPHATSLVNPSPGHLGPVDYHGMDSFGTGGLRKHGWFGGHGCFGHKCKGGACYGDGFDGMGGFGGDVSGGFPGGGFSGFHGDGFPGHVGEGSYPLGAPVVAPTTGAPPLAPTAPAAPATAPTKPMPTAANAKTMAQYWTANRAAQPAANYAQPASYQGYYPGYNYPMPSAGYGYGYYPNYPPQVYNPAMWMPYQGYPQQGR